MLGDLTGRASRGTEESRRSTAEGWHWPPPPLFSQVRILKVLREAKVVSAECKGLSESQIRLSFRPFLSGFVSTDPETRRRVRP